MKYAGMQEFSKNKKGSLTFVLTHEEDEYLDNYGQSGYFVKGKVVN